MVVYKYPLQVGRNHVPLPQGGKPLAIAFQGNDLVLWALVNPQDREVPRVIEVVMTGEREPALDRAPHYIGTATHPHGLPSGPFVVHAFDCGFLGKEKADAR